MSTQQSSDRNHTLLWIAFFTLLATLMLLSGMGIAIAENVGELGDHWAGQGSGVGRAVSTLFYIVGMAAGGGVALKLKANRDNAQQHPLSHAGVLAVVCAICLFLPQTFENSGDTFYDDNAAQNQIGGTTAIGAGGGGP